MNRVAINQPVKFADEGTLPPRELNATLQSVLAEVRSLRKTLQEEPHG
jgi:hypothetical protein